ncbi:MAG: sialate O-acetylesterase, partial [Candidatus Latescibacteria bacterium]|nr:sialate O-acetylesterase [Candidatus Latescibacterota bacterium]
DIHPRNKQDVGLRLALGALGVAYERDIVYAGPIYETMEVEDKRVRLSFKNVGTGLIAREGATLSGFAIAGSDRNFVWANAKIDGDDIIVWSDTVDDPVAVRYGWADNPDCNLYNNEGLPASPFRTDDWPGLTVGK